MPRHRFVFARAGRERPPRWIATLTVLTLVASCGCAFAEALPEPGGATPSAPDADVFQWDAFAVSSASSAITREPGGLRVALAAGDHAELTKSAFVAAPGAMRVTFNMAVSEAGQATGTQIVRVGDAFAVSNSDETDARTYARIAFKPSASGFRLEAAGRTSAMFGGTQAITWSLNHSGRIQSYDAPDGTTESTANDRMDVWVGRSKVFDDVAITTAGAKMTSIKWFWSAGPGMTSLDQWAVHVPDGGLTAEAVTAPLAAVKPLDPSSPVQLYQPTPNPFDRTTRFAYAIAAGSRSVDIGIFDVAGRRVRQLARGTQSTGEYEVQWDGRADDGSRARQGVYFLRAALGSDQRVARVVYLVQ